MMYFASGFVVGLIVGAIVQAIAGKFRRMKTIGTLRINYEDPMKDIYSIEVESLDDIENEKQVILKIETVGKP